MKLWKATYEVEVYIASETKPSYIEAGDYVAKELRDNPPFDAFVTEVSAQHRVSGEWLHRCPRGDNEDGRTVAEILAEMVKK